MITTRIRTAEATPRPHHLLPRKTTVSAVAVPVMIVGQFAFLAVVPVAIIVVTTFRRATDRPLRRLAALLAAVYTVPWVVWALRAHPAPSLSKDMDPILAGGIVAVAVAYLVTLLRRP